MARFLLRMPEEERLMKPWKCVSAAALCVGMAACGGNDRNSTQAETNSNNDTRSAGAAQEQTSEPSGKSVPLTVTGCLSSAEGRYVLTELAGSGATAQAATETYQLTNADDELRQHVGKQVRVTGEAEPARIAEVRESTPPGSASAGTAGRQGGGNDAAVSTETRTRLEVRRMSVRTVSPANGECPTSAPGTTSR
jgi:hypothetical protein